MDNESVLLRNPNTGQEINKGLYETKTADDWTSQGFLPVNSREENGGTTFYQDDPNNPGKQWQRFWQRPVVVPGVSNTPALSTGTESIQKENADAQKKLNDGLTDDEDYNATLTTLKDQLASINKYTDDDLSAIEQAGKEAASQYDSALSDAKQSRKTVLPQDIVRAGERGGFENTQYAGSAALFKTESAPGERFVGSGGLLENSRQTLDKNISYLYAAQQQAVAAAKSAAKKAIQSGKRDDYNSALDLLKVTEDIKNNIANRQIQKENLAINKNQDARQSITSAYQVIKDQQNIIANIPEGKTWSTVNPLTGETMTFEGVKSAKPFFSSSDLTQIMLKLNKGESTTLKDPNTGEDITITGVIDQAEKTTTLIDDNGYAHVINTQNGNEIAKSKTPVGKTKTQAANVTLNLTQGQSEAISAAAGKLNKTKGGGGTGGNTFWNTDVYIDERNKYGATPGADTKDFDLQYSWNLDPKDPNATRILNSIGQTPKKKSASEAIGEALSGGNINFND